MKKVFVLFLVIAMLFTVTGCGSKSGNSNAVEPQISQMKSICELAVMDCYYHNVAKFLEKDAVKGVFGIGNKDKHFWIEYSGIVKLGIDVSLVNITVEDTQVTIAIPEAQVLGCTVDSASLSKDSFIVDKNSADITVEDEVAAFAQAQVQLEQTAANDTALLANAQQRAQSLLEDYITNIGNVMGKTYSIHWEYLNSAGDASPTGAAIPASQS